MRNKGRGSESRGVGEGRERQSERVGGEVEREMSESEKRDRIEERAE